MFIILLCVVAFAALVMAVNQSGTGSGKNAADEKAQLAAAQAQNYQAQIENGVGRLKIVKGCTDEQISYEFPPGTNVNASAPLDKRCHLFDPAGAGVVYQGDLGFSSCDLTALALGAECDGLFYMGDYGGKRLYMHAAPDGNTAWGPSNADPGTYSSSGETNTDTLVGLGSQYAAANLCRALGPEWFLPGHFELATAISNVPSMFANNVRHWSSAEDDVGTAFFARNSGGTGITGAASMTMSYNVMCARSD